MKFKCNECGKEVRTNIWKFLRLGMMHNGEEQLRCYECCKKSMRRVSLETIVILFIWVAIYIWLFYFVK